MQIKLLLMTKLAMSQPIRSSIQKILILLVGFVVSSIQAVHSENLVVKANINFLKGLGQLPGEDCKSQSLAPTDICVNFAAWSVYSVEILKVLQGNAPGNKFEIAVYREGIFETSFQKNIVLVIEESTQSELIEFTGTKYVLKDWGANVELVCFSSPLPFELKNAKHSVYVLSDDPGDQSCMVSAELDEMGR